MRRNLLYVCLLAATATPASAETTFQNAFAGSSFQYTCSEIRFAYSGADPTIMAVCLKADGSPNATSLKLQGIDNKDGKLTRNTGADVTFQKSCGNIQIIVDGSSVVLSAYCRANNGMPNATTLQLNNISNMNGTLTYQ